MRRYESIDYIKVFMAVCVIAMHTTPLIQCEIQIIQRIYTAVVSHAVPFFFITTGFLLGNKINWSGKTEIIIAVIKEYWKKIVKLYVFWTIVYSPLAIWEHIKSGRGIIKAVLLYIRGFLFIGEHYNSWMLWYLLAIIYALILIMFLIHKRISIVQIVGIGAMIFILGPKLIGGANELSAYSVIIEGVSKFIEFVLGNGRLLQGMFYIPLGLWFSQKTITQKKALLMFGIGFFASCVVKNTLFNVAVMISSAGFFACVLQFKIKKLGNAKMFGVVSTVMYFIHMYVWTVYYCIRFGEKTYGLECFLATTILSVLIGVLYSKQQSVKG